MTITDLKEIVDAIHAIDPLMEVRGKYNCAWRDIKIDIKRVQRCRFRDDWGDYNFGLVSKKDGNQDVLGMEWGDED